MYHILVNPASGSGKGEKYWNRLKPILEEENIPYQVFFSQYAGNVISQIQDVLATDSHPHFIILGGDGSFNEALQGITDFDKVTLSYIPTGSSNDLARDLKIAKKPEEAMYQILRNPRIKDMDIGVVHYENASLAGTADYCGKKYFAVSCGIGFDAGVCQEVSTSTIKRTLNKFGLGKLTYLAVALKTLIQSKPVSAKLTLPDREEPVAIKNLLFQVAMNHRYEGGGFLFGPDAKDNDGILNLCMASNISRLKVLMILPTAFFGKHTGFKGVDCYNTSAFTLKSEEPLWLHTDGESGIQADYISVECLSQKIRFVY